MKVRPSLKSLVLLLLLGPSPSFAQELEGFDLNALPMPIAESPFAGLRGAERSQLGDLHWSARTSYLLQPLSISYPSPSPEGVSSAVVDGALLFELGMGVGIGAGFDVGLRIGATLNQWGPGIGLATGSTQTIASFGAADPALEVGWTLDLRVVRLRPYAGLRVPWGRQDAFAGDATARGEWGMAAAGESGRIAWGAELGLIYRPVNDISGSAWASQFRVSGGMLVKLSEEFRLGPELHLLPVLASQENRDGSDAGHMLPAEAMLNARYNAAHWDLGAAIGTGIPFSRTGDDAPLSRGPTSPLLRAMLQFGMNLP